MDWSHTPGYRRAMAALLRAADDATANPQPATPVDMQPSEELLMDAYGAAAHDFNHALQSDDELGQKIVELRQNGEDPNAGVTVAHVVADAVRVSQRLHDVSAKAAPIGLDVARMYEIAFSNLIFKPGLGYDEALSEYNGIPESTRAASSNPSRYEVPEMSDETDLYNAVRQDMMAELDAINLYEAHKAATSDAELKKIFDHVIREEKEHLEMFRSFLEKKGQLPEEPPDASIEEIDAH